MAFFTTNEQAASLNFSTLIISIPILALGILLNFDTSCEKSLHTPLITLGFFLILVSLIGMLGFSFRVKWLLFGNSLFHQNNLYLDQWGCCKPPKECNFRYVSPTVWTKNTTAATPSMNPDCMTWNNDVSSLCYDCQSCKVAVAAYLKTSSNNMALILVFYLVFIGGGRVSVTRRGLCFI